MDVPPVVGVRGILFTDMVGSSELRSRIGDDRADALRQACYAMFGSAVAAHGGQVRRWTGDGLKAAFASASATISAAIAMQREVARYGRDRTAIAPFQIRIGISVGEVTGEQDDHGVAVVEAARLEALAAPGEILATELLQRLGQRRAQAGFEEIGAHTLKGLDQPVAIVRVLDPARDEAARPIPRGLRIDRRFPMVGRNGELERVLRVWQDVRAGAAASVLVTAQPGMGKSRFVAQIAERLHDDGALVAAGSCDSELAVPYQPFAIAFSDLSGRDDELDAAVTTGVGRLGPLFPSRQVGRLDDSGPSARFALFEATVGLVRRLATDQPLVLVLEDLQWAAPPTIQLLRHLVRETTGAPLLVLASYRAEEVSPTHPLRDLLADVHASESVVRTELAPLGPRDVVDLVMARLPGAPRDGLEQFARRVHQESGGSPFFVCELLHHLSATGDLQRTVGEGGGDQLPIPDTVREVVQSRLARLSGASGEMLSTAAVIGPTFDLEVLSVLLDADPPRVLETLEEAASAAMVVEIDAGWFSFAHAIMRTTLLDAMSATRRALAHRRVAEAIEQLGRADHDELAHHWRLAGVEDKAYLNLELAARRDLEALAYESALDRYESVLEYQLRRTPADEAGTALAWLGVGLARRALDHPDFIVAIEQAGRLGRRLGDGRLVADAAIGSLLPGTYFVTRGQTQTAMVELCEDALRLAGPSEPRRALVLSALAAHLTYDDDRERRVALIAEAHEVARGLGDPEVIGRVLIAEFLSLWDPTTFVRRAEIAREVGRMARASGEAEVEYFAGFFAAICALERADVAAARGHLDALDRAIKATQNPYFAFLVERLLISLDILAARPDVQNAIDDLSHRYTGTHADTAGTWALQTGGRTRQHGNLSQFVPAIEAMIEESEVGPTWMAPYALALLEGGDRAGATAVLDELEEPPLDFFWITSVMVVGDVAAGLGRIDTVTRIRDLLEPFGDQLAVTASGTLCLGLVATTLGQLTLALGEHADAIAWLEGAVRTADAIGAPFEATRSRRLLASALTAAGRPADESRAVVEHTLGLAREHGFAGEEAALVGPSGPGLAHP